MKDPIFDPSALLTLGLEHIRNDTKSVYWSLPLAYLQYYGHPVQASRTAGQENSRITYQQFSYILLGCIFDGWKTYASTNEDGLRWIELIGKALKLDKKHRRDRPKIAWLGNLYDASKEVPHLEPSDKKAAYQLINLGRRRSTFLHPQSETPPPLFGLSQLAILIPVLKNDECRVRLLRRLCVYLRLSGSQFLIRYQSANQPWLEFASLVPMQRPPSKRTHDGIMKETVNPPTALVRWIAMSSSQLSACIRRSEEFNNLPQLVKELEKLERIQVAEKIANPPKSFLATEESRVTQECIEELQIVVTILKRKQVIEALGELCLPVATSSNPRHGFHEKGLIFSGSDDFIQASRDILQQLGRADGGPAATSQIFFAGNIRLAALFSVTENPFASTARYSSSDVALSPDYLEEFFEAENFDSYKLYDHLCSDSSLDTVLDNEQASVKVMNEVASLRACALMADVYSLLPGATISTLVVNQCLIQAKWLPGRSSYARQRDNAAPLTLAEAFACVAMFENGTCNLDPNTLSEAFAMSSGNSLYVAGSLLCDPHQQPGRSELHRVVGNIGRAGITFLISPPEVKQREPNPEKWMAINHGRFDGKLADHFQQTSVHLSFTQYEISLITEDNPRHIIDRAVVLVETLVSVYDKGAWVAEIDILRTFRSDIRRVGGLVTEPHDNKDTYEEALRKYPQLAATAIENWDELIEAPNTGAIAVQAHGNWLARLATMAVCAKHEFLPVILAHETCWACCAETVLQQGRDRVAFIC